MTKKSRLLFAVVVAILSTALVPPPLVAVNALLLECSCVPYVVMYSKQDKNDCFHGWVKQSIDNLALPTLEGWELAHPCSTVEGQNSTNSTTTNGGGVGGEQVYASATSYTNSINASKEESEGYVKGSQKGYFIGMNQGFERGKHR
jgi:hypothetical protein